MNQPAPFSPFRRTLLLALALLGLLLGGCAMQPVSDSQLTGARGAVITAAQEQIGEPYRWGGSEPGGFDCSGLVVYTHSRLGLQIPRTAEEQLALSRAVQPNELKPADLVFFRMVEKGRSSYHVGIYRGEGLFIHAPRRSKPVEIASLNSSYWRERLVRGGTFL